MNKGIIFNSKIVLTSDANSLELLETLYSWKVGMSRLKIPYRFLLYCIVLVSFTSLDAALWNRVCLNVRNKMTSTAFMPMIALKESQRSQATHSTRNKTSDDYLKTMVSEQTKEYMLEHKACRCCGKPRAIKGYHSITYRTLFGRLMLQSPRLLECACLSQKVTTISPLTKVLVGRTAPELLYLELK
jgi:hypothetical protein